MDDIIERELGEPAPKGNRYLGRDLSPGVK
jgi:hypothetical protein